MNSVKIGQNGQYTTQHAALRPQDQEAIRVFAAIVTGISPTENEIVDIIYYAGYDSGAGDVAIDNGWISVKHVPVVQRQGYSGTFRAL